MGIRRRARILAFQALYSWEFNPVPLDELLLFQWLEQERLDKLDNRARDFAVLLISGVMENRERLDDIISRKLEHWDFSRISKVDLAILRLSSYELEYQTDIPPSVVIDEAVDIAKEFGGDDSYRFINGILDSIRKTRNET